MSWSFAHPVVRLQLVAPISDLTDSVVAELALHPVLCCCRVSHLPTVTSDLTGYDGSPFKGVVKVSIL